MAEKKIVLSEVIEAVNRLAGEFHAHPYWFLYESDLQGTLLSKLRRRLPGAVRIAGSGKPESTYKLSRVYSDYGHGTQENIDIVCLDRPEAEHQTPMAQKGFDTHIYNLPVAVGIELKYQKIGDRSGFQKCLDDLKKLKTLKVEHSLVLGFLQTANDEELFFKGFAPETHHEVESITALDAVYVITPEKIWKWVEKPA